jgi:hypothetical protein
MTEKYSQEISVASAYGCAGTVSYYEEYNLFLLPQKLDASILFKIKSQFNLTMEQLKELKAIKNDQKFLIPNLDIFSHDEVKIPMFIEIEKFLVENYIKFSLEKKY